MKQQNNLVTTLFVTALTALFTVLFIMVLIKGIIWAGRGWAW